MDNGGSLSPSPCRGHLFIIGSRGGERVDRDLRVKESKMVLYVHMAKCR